MTLDDMRADFLARRLGVPSLPIAGCIAYPAAAALSLVTPAAWHNAVLTACFWSIMPIAALIGKIRGERQIGNGDNPLFQLAALMRILVLMTWAIHIPVWIHAPDLFPLTVGIAFGLHWIVFGWSIGDLAIGLTHPVLRTALVLGAWLLVPGNRMGAVSLAVAVSYAVSVIQLRRATRPRGL
jgi:hypothetical protein